MLHLFGGNRCWDPADWTASDDRVRGGKSQSYFDCAHDAPTARFHGELDIKTLGGAGFASQRTTGEDRTWNLSEYDGIQLSICEADDKQYTFILKDEILSKNPENGREQATLSYEYDFRVPKTESEAEGKTCQVFIPWKDLKATYRGREKKDAPTPDLRNVKRFSIMMRSFFGTQEGHFSLSLSSIAAVHFDTNVDDEQTDSEDEKTIIASHYSQSVDLERGLSGETQIPPRRARAAVRPNINSQQPRSVPARPWWKHSKIGWCMIACCVLWFLQPLVTAFTLKCLGKI